VLTARARCLVQLGGSCNARRVEKKIRAAAEQEIWEISLFL